MAQKIINTIEELSEDPSLGIPLVGGLRGFWKLRVGQYRVIYSVEKRELVIYVIAVGYRKDICR